MEAEQASKRTNIQECINLLKSKLRAGTLSLSPCSVGQSKSHSQPRLKGWENKLHLLIERASKSHARGINTVKGRTAATFTVYQNHNKSNLALKEISKYKGESAKAIEERMRVRGFTYLNVVRPGGKNEVQSLIIPLEFAKLILMGKE